MKNWKKKSKILIINKYVWCNKRNINIRKTITETNYKRLQKASVYIENNLIDSGGGMHLTVVFLIKIINIITGSNNITLRKLNVKPYGFDEMFMDKKVEDKLYQIIDQFNKRQITPTKVYSILFQTIYRTRLPYCLKCKKNTKSKNPKVARTRNARIMLLSKCVVCDSKNQNLSSSKKLVGYYVVYE